MTGAAVRAEEFRIRAYALQLGREHQRLVGRERLESLQREQAFLEAAVRAEMGEPIDLDVPNSVRSATPTSRASSTSKSTPSKGRFLEAYASVFDEPTIINNAIEGYFREVIRRGAFARTIAEDRGSIKSQFNHGHDQRIGSMPIGPIIELAELERGLWYEVKLSATSIADDVAALAADGLLGSSFRFAIRDGGETWSMEDDLPLREVTDVVLYELGPVVNPAYNGTNVTLRSGSGLSTLKRRQAAEVKRYVDDINASLAADRRRQRRMEAAAVRFMASAGEVARMIGDTP
jgi:Escherichia/Staphylococcus phage prohead protease